MAEGVGGGAQVGWMGLRATLIAVPDVAKVTKMMVGRSGGGCRHHLDVRTFAQRNGEIQERESSAGGPVCSHTRGVPPASSHAPALAPAFKSSSTQFSCPGGTQGRAGFTDGLGMI